MNKTNVLNWIKKALRVWISQETEYSTFELDEVFWFLKQKERSENRANVYIMTMLSRKPCQIVGFAVDNGGKIEKNTRDSGIVWV